MLNQKTIDLLIRHLDKIQTLVKEEELSNLRLFRPKKVDDWDKLNLVLDFPASEAADTLILFHLGEKISELLICPVRLVASSMIREEFKQSLLASAIELNANNIEKLKQFWKEEIMPLCEKIKPEKRSSYLFTTEKSTPKVEEGANEKLKKQKLAQIDELKAQLEKTEPENVNKTLIEWTIKQTSVEEINKVVKESQSARPIPT